MIASVVRTAARSTAIAACTLALAACSSFSTASLQPLLTASEYFSLTLSVVLVFGAVFEVPLVMFLLIYMRLVSAAFLRRHHVGVATLTPSLLTALPHTDLPDLHTVVAVGEPCPADLVTRWAQPGRRDRRVLNGYGPTETTVAVSVGTCRPGRP